MDSENIIRNTDCFPNTHFFVYRSKKYPIKYDFFKYSSNYFQKHQDEIQISQNIQLLDDESETNHDLSDDIITNFINFVQCTDIKLTPENVVGLNYLSNKYEVLTLKKYTEDYISKNHKDVAIEILLQNEEDDTFDLQSYEELISNNFEYYIQNDRLLSLNIPTLHRILAKYRLKKSDQKTNKEVVEFVFKVLKKNGRCASVLFTEVDFGDSRSEYVDRLLSEFSKEFDFHFINSSLVQTLYETQNQLLIREEEHMREIEKLNRKMQSEIERIETKSANDTRKLVDDLRREMIEDMNRIQNEMKQNKIYHEEQLKNEKDFNEKKSEVVNNEIAEIKGEIKKLKEKLNEQKKEAELKAKKESGIELLHDKRGDFNGIIKYLTDKTGGNLHDNKTIEVTSNSFCSSDHPKNLLDFNWDNYYQAKSQDDSWVCFDFKNKKVKITNYSIKSHKRDKDRHHLRSWILEISNDGDSWTTIDEHNDCQTLNGNFITGTFGVKPNDFSRYVRLHQTATPWGGHDLWFHYLEFYGYLQE